MVPNQESSALEEAIRIAGSEAKLGDLTGFSQVAINKAKKRGRCSAEMAAAIDRALAPNITKNDLRPDLWPSESASSG
jgi:DNA-binding transcriptional regulator YdaS (Cro superfamily)